MKKSMVTYMKTISKSSPDALEKIIDCKYRKFRKFYWLVCSFSEKISNMEYEDTKNNELKVILHFKKEDTCKDVFKCLKQQDDVKITRKKDKIVIVLINDEESQP